MKKIKFNLYGFLLFIIIMLPNIIWFVFPAQNDVLRIQSFTPTIDFWASIFQVIMIIFLCFVKSDKIIKINNLAITNIIFYFIFWIMYYLGIANILIILGITLFPCLAFLSYEIKSKNFLALLFTVIFTLLHFLYAIINFI